MRRLVAVLQMGLAFLVFLAPLLFLAVLMAAVDGITRTRACPRRLQRLPRTSTLGSGWMHPVLASDAERDGALQAISYAVGEGRLSFDDAEQRIGSVLHSRHRHELAELVGDLPPQAPPELSTSESPLPLRLGMLGLVALSVLAAVIVQAVAGLWELWPVAVVCCGVWGVLPRRSPRTECDR